MKFKNVIHQLTHLPNEIYWSIVVFVGSALLFTWRLSNGALLNTTRGEQVVIGQIARQANLWNNLSGLNGLYFSLGHLTYFLYGSITGARLASVIIGLCSVMLVYWVVSSWHGYRVALLAAAIFATNLSVLALSRHATPLVSQLWLGASLITGMVIIRRQHNYSGLLAWLLLGALDLYIPGAVLLVVAYIILNLTELRLTLADVKGFWRKLTPFLITIIAIAPMAIGFMRSYSRHYLAIYLGYRLHGPLLTALKQYGTNLINVPSDLFIRSSGFSPSYVLGHQPFLALADTLIIAVAVYVYITRIKDKRWRYVLTFTGLIWLMAAFGVLRPFAILPLTAIAAGTGMAYLLREWYVVFPRNPIARFGGIGLMSIVILFACIYSGRSYYVAWYNNPKTLLRFNIQTPVVTGKTSHRQ